MDRRINISVREGGQSFVELALIIVFLFILLSVAVDLGWMYFTSVSLHEIAQEGANIGSVCPSNPGIIRDRLRSSSTYPSELSSLPDDQIDICVIDPGTGTCTGAVVQGNKIRVTVTYDYHIITPFVSVFSPTQKFPLQVSATSSILLTYCPAHILSP